MKLPIKQQPSAPAPAKGEIDYVVSDSVSVAQEQHIHPNVTVAFEVTENQPLTRYLKRSEDSSLNAALLDFSTRHGKPTPWRVWKRSISAT